MSRSLNQTGISTYLTQSGGSRQILFQALKRGIIALQECTILASAAASEGGVGWRVSRNAGNLACRTWGM